MADDINIADPFIGAWAGDTVNVLKGHIRFLNVVDKGELLRGLRYKLKYRYGDVDTISFIFPLHGVFAVGGAGRGYKVDNGRLKRVVKIGNIVADSEALVKRSAKDWINPGMDMQVEKLANHIGEFQADQIVKYTANWNKKR